MFLLIDKPKGITSHDVVDKIRKITGERKVGHGGTLDPNATGLLVVGVGKDATTKLGVISKDTTKTYEAEVFLGEERDTDDMEGKVVVKAKGVLAPTEVEIRLILMTFLGAQKQTPPAYSAIKVKGKKAYEMAREGKSASLSPREVNISSIKLVSYKFPNLEIVTTVSSGTYIRAMARDIGKKLGVGAYLKNLRRTKIGMYDIESAVKLEKLNKKNWQKSIVKIR